MKSFAGKQVFLTGAAAGIGRALAIRLATAGCRLFLLDRDENGLNELLEELPTVTGGHQICVCNLTERNEVSDAIERALHEFGGVDLLINNAGVAYYGRTELMTADQWDWLLTINLLAPIQITTRLLPHLMTRPDPHIVNMCSVSGLVAGGRFTAYHTSKFGLVGFTEAIRAEYGRRGVGVSAICPGPVTTSLYHSAVAADATKGVPSPPRWLCAGPERVADVTLRAIRRNRRQVLITPTAHFLFQAKRFVPWLIDGINQFSRRRLGLKPKVEVPVPSASEDPAAKSNRKAA